MPTQSTRKRHLIDFVLESLPGHICPCTAIRRDDPFMRWAPSLMMLKIFKIPVVATTDHEYLVSCGYFPNLAWYAECPGATTMRSLPHSRACSSRRCAFQPKPARMFQIWPS